MKPKIQYFRNDEGWGYTLKIDLEKGVVTMGVTGDLQKEFKILEVKGKRIICEGASALEGNRIIINLSKDRKEVKLRNSAGRFNYVECEPFDTPKDRLIRLAQ